MTPVGVLVSGRRIEGDGEFWGGIGTLSAVTIVELFGVAHGGLLRVGVALSVL